MVPSFGVRVGVADGFEVGLRIPNLDSLAVDFKIRLLKGRFDAALDPGIQGFYTGYPDPGSPAFGVFYLQAPVLLGINISEDLSLVLSPGFAYELTTATETCGCGPESVGPFTAVWGAATASGPMARLGAGVRLPHQQEVRDSSRAHVHARVRRREIAALGRRNRLQHRRSARLLGPGATGLAARALVWRIKDSPH
jgi:hypothetical protein